MTRGNTIKEMLPKRRQLRDIYWRKQKLTKQLKISRTFC